MNKIEFRKGSKGEDLVEVDDIPADATLNKDAIRPRHAYQSEEYVRAAGQAAGWSDEVGFIWLEIPDF